MHLHASQTLNTMLHKLASSNDINACMYKFYSTVSVYKYNVLTNQVAKQLTKIYSIYSYFGNLLHILVVPTTIQMCYNTNNNHIYGAIFICALIITVLPNPRPDTCRCVKVFKSAYGANITQISLLVCGYQLVSVFICIYILCVYMHINNLQIK